MVELLLAVTFTCGLVIAAAHVVNRRFVAPVYGVVLNLVAFVSAVAASSLLLHWTPALLAAFAVGCWLVLARRTALVLRRRRDGRATPRRSDVSPGAPSDPAEPGRVPHVPK